MEQLTCQVADISSQYEINSNTVDKIGCVDIYVGVFYGLMNVNSKTSAMKIKYLYNLKYNDIKYEKHGSETELTPLELGELAYKLGIEIIVLDGEKTGYYSCYDPLFRLYFYKSDRYYLILSKSERIDEDFNAKFRAMLYSRGVNGVFKSAPLNISVNKNDYFYHSLKDHIL